MLQYERPCIKCHNVYKLGEFYRGTHPSRHKNVCFQCRTARALTHQHTLARRAQKQRARTRQRALRAALRESGLLKREVLRGSWGTLSLEAYAALKESHNACCHLCNEHESTSLQGRLYIEGGHALLCHKCKMLLGLAGMDPTLLLRAATFLMQST